MNIKYSKKLVKNLGNYESMTIEIAIEKEIDFESGETFESCYLEVRDSVNDKLKSEFSKLKKEN